MALNNKRQIERHSNGKLAYHCTWVEISPLLLKNKSMAINDKNGKCWVRVGWHRKYFNNGQLAWQLKYTDLGEPITNKFKSFRKDGSAINF